MARVIDLRPPCIETCSHPSTGIVQVFTDVKSGIGASRSTSASGHLSPVNVVLLQLGIDWTQTRLLVMCVARAFSLIASMAWARIVKDDQPSRCSDPDRPFRGFDIASWMKPSCSLVARWNGPRHPRIRIHAWIARGRLHSTAGWLPLLFSASAVRAVTLLRPPHKRLLQPGPPRSTAHPRCQADY